MLLAIGLGTGSISHVNASPAASPAVNSPGAFAWTYNGPVGGKVTVFATVSPQGTVIYAGGPGGIWKSTNSGNTWQYLPGSPAPVTLLAVDPVNTANLFAGNDTWIYKSSDNGQTFNAVYNAPVTTDPNPPHAAIHAHFTSLAVDPHTPNIVYAAGYNNANGSIYRSTNSGTNWTVILPTFTSNPGAHPLDIYQLLIDPFIPSTVYIVDASYDFCRSTDSGLTFQCYNPDILSSIFVVPDAQNVLYAAVRGWRPVWVGDFCLSVISDFYLSNNGGTGWNKIGPQISDCNDVWPSPNVADFGDPQSIVSGGCIGNFILVSAGDYPETITAEEAGVYRAFYTPTGGPVWIKANTALGNGLYRLVGGPLALSCATGGAFVGMTSGV